MNDKLFQNQQNQQVLRAVWPWLVDNMPMDMYGRLVEYLRSELGSIAARASLSLTNIIELLEKVKENAAATRSVMTEALNEKLRTYQPHSVHNTRRLADLLISAWLTTKVTSEAHAWEPTVVWNGDASLLAAFEDAFEDLKHRGEAGHEAEAPINDMPAHLTIPYLAKNHGWKVRWTSNLLQHLAIDFKRSTVAVYEHKMALSKHLQHLDAGLCCPIPRAALEEALDTLNLLFPPGSRETREFLAACGQPFHDDGTCGRVERRDLAHYKHWRRSLVMMRAELGKPRRGVRQLVVDAEHGNLIDVVTFWVAAIVAMTLALGFGISATYYAAKSYDMSAAQYYLALAQACASPGANESLPQYCGT